ncbi:hypothetical protein SADUNF_Sadunf16G0241500 [Salix dunnii]|uniref:Pentatricopeptide repeat-containing protein n=1 Tax=Salix dunnii TaxID=1413687 RepID=A0A835MJW9_9ROSI|nr:hypothetical protein SADUNF_Sadunf16G0241500 [Salix dunnii]
MILNLCGLCGEMGDAMLLFEIMPQQHRIWSRGEILMVLMAFSCGCLTRMLFRVFDEMGERTVV